MLEAVLSRFKPGAATAAARHLSGGELVDLLCPAGLSPASARLEWARRVLVHYHGETAASWPLLAWEGFGARGVSACRGHLPAAGDNRPDRVDARWPLLLQALLQSRPALRRAEAGRALLVEADADGSAVLTQLRLSLGRVQALQRHRLDAPWTQALQAQLQDALQDPDAGRPVVAAWVHGHAAAAQATTLADAGLDAQARPEAVEGLHLPWSQDFTRPQARPAPVAWLALAGGVLLLLAALWILQQAWQQRTAAAAVAIPVEAAPRRVTAQALPAALAQRLNHPWREVFLAAEKPAVAGLSWLALDHHVGGELRLQGMARTPEAVQRAATALREQAPWQRVLVARLESEDKGVVFELTAQGPGSKP